MIIRVEIKTDCKQCLYYQNQQGWFKIDKHKTRLSEYEREELLKTIDFDPSKDSVYLYRIHHPDGSFSIVSSSEKKNLILFLVCIRIYLSSKL